MKEVIYPPCKRCGESHGMGIETMETGEVEPINLCKNCSFYGKVITLTEPVIFIGNNENEEEE
jgi:hypothetical protein